jgi:hypothetical protein
MFSEDGISARLRFLNPDQAQCEFLCAFQRYGGTHCAVGIA